MTPNEKKEVGNLWAMVVPAIVLPAALFLLMLLTSEYNGNTNP